MKPIKRGIKFWMRCDTKTGYTYDLNIYTGIVSNYNQLIELPYTFGKRVVMKLSSSIRENDVCLVFGSFFSSIKLLDTLDRPAIGTYMGNRKNISKFSMIKAFWLLDVWILKKYF